MSAVKTFSKRKRDNALSRSSSSLDSPTSSPSIVSSSSSSISSPPSSQDNISSSQPSSQTSSSSQTSQPSENLSQETNANDNLSSSPPSTPTKKLKQWDWRKPKSEGSPQTPKNNKNNKNKTITPKKTSSTTKKTEQTFLDLDCGMMYAPGVAEDVLMHTKFHKKHESIINFPQWKSCRVVKEYPFSAGSVICVGKDDTPANQNKVYKVRKMMDKELGYVDASNPSISADHKIFLFIAKNKVVGCIVAEQIEHAYPVIIIEHGAKKETSEETIINKKEEDKNNSLSTPTKKPPTLSPPSSAKKQKVIEEDDLDLDKICETDNTTQKKVETKVSKPAIEEDDELDRICEMESSASKNDKSKPQPNLKGTPSKRASKEAGIKNFSVSCSKESQKAVCGISRIWTARTHRRQGIASKMLDCVRSNLIYGYTVPKELCAFSQPTADGKLFFESYRGTNEFLVYL